MNNQRGRSVISCVSVDVIFVTVILYWHYHIVHDRLVLGGFFYFQSDCLAVLGVLCSMFYINIFGGGVFFLAI